MWTTNGRAPGIGITLTPVPHLNSRPGEALSEFRNLDLFRILFFIGLLHNESDRSSFHAGLIYYDGSPLKLGCKYENKRPPIVTGYLNAHPFPTIDEIVWCGIHLEFGLDKAFKL